MPTFRLTQNLCVSLLAYGAVSACGGTQGAPTDMNPETTAGSAGSNNPIAGAPSAGFPASAGAMQSAAGSSGDVAGGAGIASAGASPSAGSSGTSSSDGGSSGAAGSGLAGSGAAGTAGTGTAGTGTAGTGGNLSDLPPVTLHLAGDSTVMDYGTTSAQEGWGQELGQFFSAKVSIDNRALGGTSVRTFQSRWTPMVAALKAGDFVMADFGINDSGSTAGRAVSTTDFRMYMSQMNDQVKAKSGTFIIVTPSALQYWSAGKETNARLAPYVAVETMLGTSSGIPIVDLNAQSLEFLNMIGQTAAMQIYINGDKAHFTKKGATQMASFVASELRRIQSPLARYLK